jgi:hypothetical protein
LSRPVKDPLRPLSQAERAVLEQISRLRTDPAEHVIRAKILLGVSDGQHSIRKAVRQALPGIPHQLCHFHYLREAARPIYEADRHAKKELKKHVRGIRVLERQVEGRTDAEAEVVGGYCAAVRSALSDDGRAPLDAAGLKLQERLSAIEASLARAEKKGDSPAS